MISNRDLTYYLYTPKGDKTNRTSKPEERYFKKINENMVLKSIKRIDDIKERILNDVSKNCYNRKYQIQNEMEYKIIKEYVIQLNIHNYNMLWHHDMIITRNKLFKIIQGDYSCCDTPMKFINIKKPVMYCYFYKSK